MHASYKASAFIAIGYIIGSSSSQDVRTLAIDTTSHLWLVLLLVYTHYGTSSYAYKSSILSDYAECSTNSFFVDLLLTPLLSI